MKFYLAGSQQWRGLVDEVCDAIEKCGHTCTHKWWNEENFKKRNVAVGLELDLLGVSQADVLVALVGKHGAGTYYEMGYARGKGVPVIAVELEQCPCEFVYGRGLMLVRDMGTISCEILGKVIDTRMLAWGLHAAKQADEKASKRF